MRRLLRVAPFVALFLVASCKKPAPQVSAVDWKNIKLISSVEDSLGGPLSDGEHFGRTYGWFGGA